MATLSGVPDEKHCKQRCEEARGCHAVEFSRVKSYTWCKLLSAFIERTLPIAGNSCFVRGWP